MPSLGLNKLGQSLWQSAALPMGNEPKPRLTEVSAHALKARAMAPSSAPPRSANPLAARALVEQAVAMAKQTLKTLQAHAVVFDLSRALAGPPQDTAAIAGKTAALGDGIDAFRQKVLRGQMPPQEIVPHLRSLSKQNEDISAGVRATRASDPLCDGPRLQHTLDAWQASVAELKRCIDGTYALTPGLVAFGNAMQQNTTEASAKARFALAVDKHGEEDLRRQLGGEFVTQAKNLGLWP